MMMFAIPLLCLVYSLSFTHCLPQASNHHLVDRIPPEVVPQPYIVMDKPIQSANANGQTNSTTLGSTNAPVKKNKPLLKAPGPGHAPAKKTRALVQAVGSANALVRKNKPLVRPPQHPPVKLSAPKVHPAAPTHAPVKPTAPHAHPGVPTHAPAKPTESDVHPAVPTHAPAKPTESDVHPAAPTAAPAKPTGPHVHPAVPTHAPAKPTESDVHRNHTTQKPHGEHGYVIIPEKDQQHHPAGHMEGPQGKGKGQQQHPAGPKGGPKGKGKGKKQHPKGGPKGGPKGKGHPDHSKEVHPEKVDHRSIWKKMCDGFFELFAEEEFHPVKNKGYLYNFWYLFRQRFLNIKNIKLLAFGK
ncbi:unnamed protein product [Trichobilharzia szidati]|nr:unnamed protein product [Trichobilharzia szidati]